MKTTDRPVRRFVLHYLEMVVAMVVGMVALGPLADLLFTALDWTAAQERVDLKALTMAVNMTIAMSAWMLFRGHTWASTAEMGAAMIVPFVVLFPFVWAGWMSGPTLYVVGHVLMLVGMLVAMLYRRDEYMACHAPAAEKPAEAASVES